MRDVFRIFVEMRDLGIVLDVIIYNIFIGFYAVDSMFEEVIGVVRYMIKNGCRLNQNIYNFIVDGYCKLNRKDEVKLFVEDLKNFDFYVFKDEE